jgi:hypothetical protein
LITASGDRKDDFVSRLGAREGFAQQKDMLTQIALLGARIGPESFQQFFFADNLLRAENHEDKQIKGPWTDRDGIPPAPQGAMSEINLELLKSILALRLEGHVESECRR